MRVLAVIPARGGSKRVKNKNLRQIAGEPLVKWTINEAKKSKLITDLMLSTDSEEIAELGLANGVQVPFLRPPELSGDHAKPAEALVHLLKKTEREDDYDIIIMLPPTSPLRRVESIDSAINLMAITSVKAVVSVTELGVPLEWTMRLDSELFLDGFIAEQKNTLKSRSQDSHTVYRLNGAIYVTSPAELMAHETFYLPSGVKALKMSPSESIDIDSEDDFAIADAILSKRFF